MAARFDAIGDIKIGMFEDGTNPIVTVNLGNTYECLGSSVLNGGLTEADHILMYQVDMAHIPDEDPSETLSKVAERNDLGNRCIGFMTAAEIHTVLSVKTVTIGGISVTAFVTGGLGNGIVAGDSFYSISEQVKEHKTIKFGTINIVCVSSEPLDDTAKANALMDITEAKTVALRELGIKYTGTTTDSYSILSPRGSNKIKYCGTGTTIGVAIARSVKEAVKDSLVKGNEVEHF